MNVGFSWVVIDRIPNLFDPIQSVRSQQPTETGNFRGLTSFWMKIEVKRNQVRLRYLSEILSEILSEKENSTKSTLDEMPKVLFALMEGKKYMSTK